MKQEGGNMPRTIISEACPGKGFVQVTCPFCGQKKRLGRKSTVGCDCHALHRWTGQSLYHIPSIGKNWTSNTSNPFPGT